MDRWTMRELKETDDITFAIDVLYERRKSLNPYSPLSQKITEAIATLNRIRYEAQSFIAKVAETQIAPVTDFSDCDEATKAQIVENARLLDERDAMKCDPCQPTQPECGECEYAGGNEDADE